MPKSKYSETEKKKILVEAKSGSVAAVARKYNVRANVIYNWLRRESDAAEVFAAKKRERKVFDEISFLKSELEKRDKIILQFALKHFGQNL